MDKNRSQHNRGLQLLTKGMVYLNNNELKLLLKIVIDDALQEALQPIKEDIQSLKTDIAALKTDVHELKVDVAVLKTDVEVLKTDMHKLKTDVQVLESGQGELHQLTRAIYDRQEETDARMESLTMDVHKATGSVTSLKQGQERHEKILGSLALRSLEQETDLRELKHA